MLLLMIANAQAMNWEGHDDWMIEKPAAIAYREQVPGAAPKPRRDCRILEEKSAHNPYEQVPLPRHGCLKGLPPDRSDR